MKLILWAFLFFSPLARGDDGHSTGNAGGVICIEGRCSTLFEAGLRLQPEFDGVWIPEREHYTRVEKLVDEGIRLFEILKKRIFYSVFEKTDHFRRVNVI